MDDDSVSNDACTVWIDETCRFVIENRVADTKAPTAGYEMEGIRRFDAVCAFDDDGVSGIVPTSTSGADVEIG